MTYVVNDNCISCKYMDCMEVCPVDCFYEGENLLVIHPDECIDCGVCEPECPADAIKPDTEPGLDKWLNSTANTPAFGRILPSRRNRCQTRRSWMATRVSSKSISPRSQAQATELRGATGAIPGRNFVVSASGGELCRVRGICAHAANH